MQNRIIKHTLNADHVPIDMVNFSPAQPQRVVEFVHMLADPSVFVVGP